MVDDVTLPGTGSKIATDDDGTRQYQWVKHVWGPDDTFNKVDVAANKMLPIQLRHSDGTIISDATGLKLSTSQLAPLNTTAQPMATGYQLVDVPTDGTNASRMGALTETAPGTDTASSGLNGRLQRIAQNITTMIAATLKVAGAVAHAAADSGNPVKIGARARSSEITALANDNRSDLLTDLAGKLLVLPYANPENFVSGAITTAMTATTSTLLIAAPAAGLRNYITQITVSNSHATVGTDVIIQDGSTTIYVVPAAAVFGGAVLTFPTPLRQPTTATAINCANVTTGASTKVSASGYKGV